ncbi:MAG TPA: hypothetical protein VJ767_09610 [Nitrososphaeraceae archaeon]|nr:hypothetical protein [Nitrososphaeraceae archaeon]
MINLLKIIMMKTLQIATFGTDGQDAIAFGIKTFPIHKLVLLCFHEDKSKAEDFSRRIKSILGLPITITLVAKENVIRDTMDQINEVLQIHGKEFDDILMNVSCGDKLLGCAALSTAFIHGVKAFGMDYTHTNPLMMPVLKLSYNEIISDAKKKILVALDSAGGNVESFDQLEKISGFGKPLLSYHIQGSREAKGLAELGLADVEKGDRNKISVTITTLGKLLINSTLDKQ